MNSEVNNVQLVDQIGLSSLTIRLTDGRHEGVAHAWSAKSQPGKLLFISILIMTCLCGSIYYGTMNVAQAAQRTAPGK